MVRNHVLHIRGSCSSGVAVCDQPSQLDDFAFHLRIATALPDAPEVGFDLALELQATASAAGGEGLLNDVATKLQARHQPLSTPQADAIPDSPFAVDTHCKRA